MSLFFLRRKNNTGVNSAINQPNEPLELFINNRR